MGSIQLSTEGLLQLAAAMRQGVRVKDRRYLFRSYRRCFVGQEAVAWLMTSGAASSTSEAIRIGNKMMELGLFHHVVYEHVFEDDYLFYRFTEDDDASRKAYGSSGTQEGAASSHDRQNLNGTAAASVRLRKSPSRGASFKALATGTKPLKLRASGTMDAASVPQARGSADVTTAVAAAGAAAAGSAVAAGSGPAPTTPQPSPTAAAGAAAAGGTMGGLTVLSETRLELTRQVMSGHLTQLQERVTHMALAADAQRSIVDILVSEVSTLRGEVSELRTQLKDAAVQLQHVNAVATHGSQQLAGLRLLTLGLCGCVLQQAVMNWLGSGAGMAGGGGGSPILAGGMSCWGVALAAALTLLCLTVLLPVRRSRAAAAAEGLMGAGSDVRLLEVGSYEATAGEGAPSDAKRSTSANAGAGFNATAADGGGGAGDELSGKSSGSESLLAAAAGGGGGDSGTGANGARRNSMDFVRRYAEVARQFTAPLRLHLPGKRRLDAAAPRRRSATAPESLSMAERERRKSGSSVSGVAVAATVASDGAASGAGERSVEGVERSSQVFDACTAARALDSGAAGGGEGPGFRDQVSPAPSIEARGSGGSGGGGGGVVATPSGRGPLGTALPCLSDFDGWPDAPVLLAFHTGAVPEHATAASAALMTPSSSLRAMNEEFGSERASAASAAAAAVDAITGGKVVMPGKDKDMGAPEVRLRVNAGSQQRLPQDAAAAAAAGPGTGAASPGATLLESWPSGRTTALAAAADAAPSPPMTPSGPSEAGGARPFPSLPVTPGLVRVPANGVRPVRVETELFSGELVVMVRGLATTPEQIFVGKKRMSWVAMQGRFKKPLRLDAVVTGQEFARPFTRLPAAWFVEKVLLSMAKQVSPSMRVGPLSSPYLTMPIIAAAQLVNVSKAGCQPPLMECPEDVSLFCPRLTSAGGTRPASSDARRRHFSAPRNRTGLSYDTDNVWTFHFWQQFVDVASYKLDFGYTYDLVQHLDGQPLQVMAKDVDSGSYLYNVLMWHERLVPSALAAAGATAPGAGALAPASADISVRGAATGREGMLVDDEVEAVESY